MYLNLVLIILLPANILQDSLLPIIDTERVQISKSISFSKSKKFLQNIYLRSNKNVTFYCGCAFNLEKEIDIESCNYSPKNENNKRSRRLEFEHVVPASKLGKNLQCWKEPICQTKKGKNYKGRRCCKKVSKEFKRMEADMHNLFPSIGEVNGDRSNYSFGEIPNENRNYGQCDFEILNKVAEPKESIRGDIARSYFYMSKQYEISIPESYENLLRQWHLSDPPDDWERDRNSFIEEIQGNRNPFIDYPEKVERFRDF